MPAKQKASKESSVSWGLLFQAASELTGKAVAVGILQVMDEDVKLAPDLQLKKKRKGKKKRGGGVAPRTLLPLLPQTSVSHLE